MADRARRRKYNRTSSNSSNSVDPNPEEERMGKPRSDVSPGGSKEQPEKKKVRSKRERWLLTRKTWRYMADAGRRLIPEGLQNRPEDVPKIEAYFQEVCQKEPRFLLWRKQSYPGALGFRSRGRSRGGRKKLGGSYRDKTSSADEAEDIKKGSPRPGVGFTPQLTRKLGSRLDLKKLKEEFLLGSWSPHRPPPHSETQYVQQTQSTLSSPEEESNLLLETLEMYLNEKPGDPKAASTSKSALNHEELLIKLGEHLATIERVAAEERARSARSSSTHFEGDHMQKMLLETIRRHFGKSTNREKVISDMLTDRKSLERLYFDLRKTRGFKCGRRGADSALSTSFGGTYSVSRWRPSWRPSGTSSPLHYQDLQEEEGSDEEGSTDSRQNVSSDPASPPPLIEIESEKKVKTKKEKCYATQTEAIPGSVLVAIQEELKRLKLAKQEAEEKEAKEEQSKGRSYGRRSSVTDNDDVSPSVGDTIKRYLRMARKKSIDSDKADRFKRVNYDKNIRNIKAKGEITQIGDDDGLDKGVQTEESWVVALKELKLEDKLGEMSPPCEDPSSSRITSSRSSDTGVEDLSSPPHTPIPPTKSPSGILSSGQTFLSNLLHHQKTRNAPSSVSAVPAVMQKSKSSSSVVHQGSRLVAKKIWKSRSKSQNRATSSATSAWTPQGNCQWTNVAGRTISISETTLLQLSDIERRVLQKVALAKLQALNLGVAVRIPSDTVAATSAVQKPKRRAYLLKRKAITTGFFDSKTGKEEKDKTEGGLVFGVPLGQCVESERLARGGKVPLLSDDSEELRRKSHHSSRSSFTSLIEPVTREEKGSSESLICPTLSMPGMLDTLSMGSALDLSQDSGGVPNIVSSCLRHLETYGLHKTGIFRVSSSKKRVRQLREDFDCGKFMLLDSELCPHDVATLLKEYFRDLPDALLCKDLFSAFIQTQRIRNRRLQYEALQHLIQLLPVPNRDTLWALLCLLSQVAKNAEGHKNHSGEWVEGNKMDSNNLATLFAPNILHACKPVNKDDLGAERTEERSDAINVIRALIDNHRNLYQVSAELLDEVYVHMMDSHPETLDQILQRRDLATEETEDLEESIQSEDRLRVPGDSQDSLVSYSVEEHKVWSREAFTHETAGMGGPDLEMKPRKDRGRERGSKKRWREEQTSGRRRLDSDQSTPSRRTSSTSYPDDSGCPDDPMMFQGKTADSGVITASLKIPVPSSAALIDDSDIPFIEDSERHQITLGVVRSSHRVSSDSSQASAYVQQTTQYHDSAVGSSVSPPRNSVSSYSSGGVFSSPPSWASTPPTSPDHMHTTVNYLPDEPTTARITIPTKKTPDPQQRVTVQRVTIKSAGEVQQVKQSYSRQESSSSVTTQEQQRRRSKDYQRLATGERRPSAGEQLVKSASTSTVAERTVSIVREGERTTVERAVTPSISSIGGAVLRSKTADIERMLKIQSAKQTKKTTGVSVTSEEEKKIKRKYTDSRHLTRTLPQSTETTEAESSRTEQRRSGVVWKRRELISSEPKERKGFL